METHPVSTLNTYNPSAPSAPKSFSASKVYKDLTDYTKTASSSASSSMSSSVSTFPWWYWLIIIMVLAFFGINVFIYLAQGTQILANITKYFASIFISITKTFTNLTLQVTKQITNITAIGAKKSIDVAAGTINAGANALEQPDGATGTNPVPNTSATVNKSTTITATPPPSNDNQLNAALKNAAQTPEYMADETSSSLTMSKSTNKAGWCYIGQEQGYRSCAEVGANDSCMSGDIFPSRDICINPSLR